jgi:hypothetical protein
MPGNDGILIFLFAAFVSWPGLKKAHKADSVDLIWTTDEDIGFAEEQTIYHTEDNDDYILLKSIFGGTGLSNDCEDRCTALLETRQLGVRIPGVTTQDARKYVAQYKVMVPFNDNAVIYVYRKSFNAVLI